MIQTSLLASAPAGIAARRGPARSNEAHILAITQARTILVYNSRRRMDASNDAQYGFRLQLRDGLLVERVHPVQAFNSPNRHDDRAAPIDVHHLPLAITVL